MVRVHRLNLDAAAVKKLFRAFDRNNDNHVSYEEFLVTMRGEMSARRKKLVALAFSILDKTGDGQVTIEDVKDRFDASKHPDVMGGKKTEAEVGGV